MDHQPIDKLLENRIKAAHRDRVVRILLLIAAVLIVIGCGTAAIVHNMNRSAGEQTEPEPTQPHTEETVVSPSAEASLFPQEDQSKSPVAETTPPQTEEPAVPESIETSTPPEDESSTEEVIEELPAQTGEPERVTHEMQVVWFGDSDVPDSLTVHVMYGSDELLTVTLTEADHWYYAWEDTCHGQDLRLEGDYPDHISVEYSVSGDHFTLTATSIQGDLPQTGAIPFGAVFTMLAGAAITVISLAARNKESE